MRRLVGLPVFAGDLGVGVHRAFGGGLQRVGGQAGLGREPARSEEHTSELQSHHDLVCRLLIEKKNKKVIPAILDALLTHSGVIILEVKVRLILVLCWPSLDGFQAIVFFFNDTATTEIYTLSLHDALPI